MLNKKLTLSNITPHKLACSEIMGGYIMYTCLRA